MEKFLVKGGNTLSGEINIGGAKNAAVAILPATVMARGRCVIENVPDISDVRVLLDILSQLGAKIEMLSNDTVAIDTTDINSNEVPYELAKMIRASYYFIGALLGRCSEAHVSMPGGCNLGVRPIDQHLKGFQALGAEVTVDGGIIHAKADRMLGSHIHFDVVSVGATINVMMAAVRAHGITIMENVAKEPHIVDLANFLNSMGADIRGAGTDVIKIHGVDMLRPSTYSIIPDQIEAGTYMVMAAATGSSLLIKNVIPKHLEAITDKLISSGAEVEEFDDSIRVTGGKVIKKINVKAMPHPGFPTDMQPQITAMLCRAEGTSIITEGVWEGGRFRYTDELKRMGANISVDGKMAVVEGVSKLTGAPVRAADLRAGAAMIIAALTAEGTTEIEDIHYIERGYENIVAKLTAVGADIQKIIVPDGDSMRQAQ
ncbi:MAG: UDP-N-acetylglucosamine 1-carboxyvinyltransferase [Oscillospiraceae bacterium]|nr:UDP-N-acetylglucosamine 1-carboxyvinyltransferase [Oscillospiraceae bacterium]MBQ4539407.1 UDP-N-acetylglucosamine 1-carboxyvinyltransferase [Oscillospiraceae bacterium]